MSFVIQGMISIPNPNKPVKSVDVLKRLFKQTLLHQNFHVCTNVAELASIFKRLLRLVPHPYIYIHIYISSPFSCNMTASQLLQIPPYNNNTCARIPVPPSSNKSISGNKVCIRTYTCSEICTNQEQTSLKRFIRGAVVGILNFHRFIMPPVVHA